WHVAKLNTSLKLTFTALLYTFISIPLTRITGIGMDLDSLQWVNSTFFPSLAQNLLASYLAFLGGALPALVYRAILQYFAWFCPILPDLDWDIKGLLGTGIPIMALIAVETLYASQQKRLVRKGRRKSRTRSLIGWGVTGLVVLLLVLLSTGAFGVKPTVIVSGSMEPAIDIGDITLVRKVNPDSIEEGDIIKFKGGDERSVIHRVIGVTTEDNVKVFQTKGDANDGPDRQPVYADRVEGKVVFTIPKVGWLSIGVKELLGQ
ncbi:MAG: signal peptidase I, partial [Chloroflexi bacterium]|nr:signal peptidase I [Chloroflexota bacterium]